MNSILYATILLVNTLFCVFMAGYVQRQRRAPGHSAFSWILLLGAVWSAAYALEILMPHIAEKIFFAKIQYFGIVFLPAAWLFFALEYTGFPRNFKTRWFYLLFFLIPVITLVLALTNESHSLIWVHTAMPLAHEFPGLQVIYGAWFWIFAVYAYLVLMTSAAVMLLNLKKRNDRFSRWQIYLALLALSVPWVANSFYILRPNPAQVMDWTTLGFSLSGVAFAVNMFLFNWLEIFPVAYEQIVQVMLDPVFVLDSEQKIVAINPAAIRLFGADPGKWIGSGFRQALQNQMTFPLQPESHFISTMNEVTGTRYFDVQVIRLFSGRIIEVGSLVMMHNITQEKVQQEMLEKAVAARTQELEQANLQLNHELILRKQVETRYRTLFEDAPVMYIVSHIEQGKLVIAECNRLFLETLDYRKEDVIGHTVDEFSCPVSQDENPEEDLPLQVGDQIIMMEQHLVTHSGKIIDTLAQAMTETDENGNVITVRIMYLDITEQKAAEEAILQMADQRQKLLEISLSMVSILDPDKIIDQTLASLKDLVGYDYGAVYLVDENTQLLRAEWAIGAEPYLTMLQSLSAYSGQTLIRSIFTSGRGELVNNAHLDPRTYYPEDMRPQVEHVICLPVQVRDQKIGIFRLSRITSHPFSQDDFELIQPFVNQTGIAIQNARLFAAVERQVSEIREQQKNIRLVTARLQDVQQRESRHLASELHDRVGQNLTSLGVNVKLIQVLAQNKQYDRMNDCLKDTADLLGETTRHVRDLLSEMRPAGLDDYGLCAALRLYGQTVERRTGLPFEFSGNVPGIRLPPATESAMFRIAQEAVTNVIKHAAASRVKISLESTGDKIILSIQDDGKGFQPETASALGDTPHYGLLTIRERALAIGAEAKIDSVPGQGTCVQIIIGGNNDTGNAGG